jgi:hypothetical protein
MPGILPRARRTAPVGDQKPGRACRATIAAAGENGQFAALTGER